MGYAGFKLIRPEDAQTAATSSDGPAAATNDDEDADSAVAAAPDADAGVPETLYWFLFPLAAKPEGSSPRKRGRLGSQFALGSCNVLLPSGQGRAGSATVRSGARWRHRRHGGAPPEPCARHAQLPPPAYLSFRRRTRRGLALPLLRHRSPAHAGSPRSARQLSGTRPALFPEAWQTQVESILSKT